MKLAEAIGEALWQLGARAAFGVVGSGNFHLTETLRRHGAAFVAARQETSAAAMADGYAAVTGVVGVVTCHQGPGFTNAITGMVEAAKSRSRVLLVAADTPSGWTHSNFRVGQAEIAEAGGIEVVRIGATATAAADVARAWHTAAIDRRATVLLVPLDVQDAVLAEPLSVAERAATAPVAPDPDDVASVAELLAGVERPVIVAGRGAVLAGAGPALVELADATGALLATSVVANGLFAAHPWNLGISGGFATPLAAELIPQADVVLAVGASLNRWTTRHGRLLGTGARVVQIDDDRAAIGVHHPGAIGLVADARLGAEAILDRLRSRRWVGWRTPELGRRIATETWRGQPFEDASTESAVDPRTVTIAMDAILPRNRLVVVDGGHFSGWPAMYLEAPDARSFLFHQAFQSIGLGLGTAIGAAVGAPDRTVVAAVGDGCAFMALGELETMARLRLPMIVLVYNDDAYGAEVHHFAEAGVAFDTVRFAPTDLAAVARALGAEGVTVRGVDDLAAVEAWVAGSRAAPLVVDLKVAPAVVGAWLPEAFRA